MDEGEAFAVLLNRKLKTPKVEKSIKSFHNFIMTSAYSGFDYN